MIENMYTSILSLFMEVKLTFFTELYQQCGQFDIKDGVFGICDALFDIRDGVFGIFLGLD